jgi:hypothetical protein
MANSDFVKIKNLFQKEVLRKIKITLRQMTKTLPFSRELQWSDFAFYNYYKQIKNYA